MNPHTPGEKAPGSGPGDGAPCIIWNIPCASSTYVHSRNAVGCSGTCGASSSNIIWKHERCARRAASSSSKKLYVLVNASVTFVSTGHVHNTVEAAAVGGRGGEVYDAVEFEYLTPLNLEHPARVCCCDVKHLTLSKPADCYGGLVSAKGHVCPAVSADSGVSPQPPRLRSDRKR